MLKRFFGKRGAEKRSVGRDYLNNFLSLCGWSSKAGANVSFASAVSYPALWACVRNISETVASLPVEVIQVIDGTHVAAENHPVQKLMHDPNPEQNRFKFKEVVQFSLLTRGNAYIYIERDRIGKAKNLWPLNAASVEIKRSSTGELFYRAQVGGEYLEIMAMDIIHIQNTGHHNLTGLSPIQVHRESIGLSLAANEFGAQFFGRGTIARGVIEVDSALSDQAQERLKKGWQSSYEGLDNAFSTPVLEEGMKFKPISLPPNDAQFLETRRYQAEDIARIFRMPQHMVGILDKATFSNITEQSLDYGKHTIMPWLTRWECELERKLLREDEKGKFIIKFNMDELLRGDPKTRSEYFDRALKGGWMSVNEVRRKENLNPVSGGDVHLRPLNMAPLDAPYEQLNPDTAPDESGEDRSYPVTLKGFDKPFQGGCERLLAGESNIVKRLIQNPQSEEQANQTFEKVEDLVSRALGPIVEGMSDAMGLPEQAAQDVIQQLQRARVCIVQEMSQTKKVEEEKLEPSQIFEEVRQALENWSCEHE